MCVWRRRCRRDLPPRYQLVTPGPRVLLHTGVAQTRTAIDLGLGGSASYWWFQAWCSRGSRAKCIGERQARLDTMRAATSSFLIRTAAVSQEHWRTLGQVAAAVPRRRTLGPSRAADGRTYPNLFDHRKNVDDVERVLQLLRDAPFTSGPLHTDGAWVVIPFRLETDRQQEGVP
jgi:hypothetical protein